MSGWPHIAHLRVNAGHFLRRQISHASRVLQQRVLELARHFSDAGGVTEISRWSSEANTTGTRASASSAPEGAAETV